MSFTGHSTESIYTRYAIVDSEAQRHGAKKIPGLDRPQYRHKRPRTHRSVGGGVKQTRCASRAFSRGAARIRTGDKGFAVLCLTTWPRRQCEGGVQRWPPAPFTRAVNRTRTGDPNLGKVVLYQLSYSRVC